MKFKDIIVLCSTTIILIMAGCLEMEVVDQPGGAEVGSTFSSHAMIEFKKDGSIGDDDARTMLFAVNKPSGWTINSVTYVSPEHGTGSFNYLGNDADESDPSGIDTGWEDSLEAFHPSADGMHWLMYVSDQDSPSSSSEEDPDSFHVEINYTVDNVEGSYMLKYYTTHSNNSEVGNETNIAVDSANTIAYDPASSPLVTFTVTDHTWLNEDIWLKGSMSNWNLFPANDDGEHGDLVADDHTWTGQFPVIEDGAYTWGAIEDDGSQNGIWLIDGPNVEFSVSGATVTGETHYDIAPDSAVSAGSVKFMVTDSSERYSNIQWMGTPHVEAPDDDWIKFQMYNDGTNGDETAGDLIWTIIVPDVAAGDHQWGAVEDDGTENGEWLIEGGTPSFTLDEDLLTLHGETDYLIPALLGEDITKTILFSVDMTEWLDEEGNIGMGVFSIGRGDEMQVRGSFNGWGDCIECTMTRTPGTNIFSHAINVTAQPNSEHNWAFYMHLSEASLDSIEARFGTAPVDWIGWETSPINEGNRIFNLGEDDGTNILELPIDAYYDVFPGLVLEQGKVIDLTLSIDMSAAVAEGFDASEDSVYLRTHDKWLNLSQGFSNGQDLNHYGATLNDDGTYSMTVPIRGPQSWCIYYKWGFKDVSLGSEVSEAGGGLGGTPRIRYLRRDANNNCNWPSSFAFPLDETFTTDEDLVFTETWDSSAVCVQMMASEEDFVLPKEYYISDNYPNPFNPKTKVEINLPVLSDISFTVYSITGVEVFSYSKKGLDAGSHSITWNGRDFRNNPVSSGVYLYEFRAGNEFRQTKKMTLLK